MQLTTCFLESAAEFEKQQSAVISLQSNPFFVCKAKTMWDPEWNMWSLKLREKAASGQSRTSERLLLTHIMFFPNRLAKTGAPKCSGPAVYKCCHAEGLSGLCKIYINEAFHYAKAATSNEAGMAQRLKGFLLSTCLAPSLSSPGRHLQLDDNDFHLSACCFMSSCLVRRSWIT